MRPWAGAENALTQIFPQRPAGAAEGGSHPTFAWESVTEVRLEDGLILLITGNLKWPHGEFWLEPDEQIAVIRHPESNAVETQPTKANTKHGHK